MRVLVANRGEIAIRIIQALEELSIESVALAAPKDTLHTLSADAVVEIPGASTFMDSKKIIELAKDNRCSAIAPGYGFLSESSEFAKSCEDNEIVFVGPSSRILAVLGDKSSAKRIAKELQIPILPSASVKSASDIRAFAAQVKYPVMIKARDGGGGKGIRIVRSDSEIEETLVEATNESPSREVFCEKAALEGFKHIEIQIVGDRQGNVRTIFERECSLQRRFQKIIEIAPSSLPRSRIAPILQAAQTMAQHVNYVGLGTFEFLVDSRSEQFFFMECNPRLQVEHTITEQVANIDLVHLLLGTTLKDLDLRSVVLPVDPTGASIQCRVNAEHPETYAPSRGTIVACQLPSGSGIRVDSVLSNLRPGTTYTATDEYDSLLAKVITTSTNYKLALRKALFAMSNVQIDGVTTNKSLLLGLLKSELLENPLAVDIRSLSQPKFVETMVQNGNRHVEEVDQRLQGLTGEKTSGSASASVNLAVPASSLFKKGDQYDFSLSDSSSNKSETQTLKISKILKNNFPTNLTAEISIGDVKKVLSIEKSTGSISHRKADPLNPTHIALPFAGVLIEVLVELGDRVEEAETIAVFRQGKMELDVRSPFSGTVTEVSSIREGDSVGVGALIAVVTRSKDRARL